MAHKAHVIAATVLASILLAGCATVEENLELRKPAARLVDVKFTEAGPYSATLVFDVTIKNYYALTVPLRRFTYELSSAGATFLAGSAEIRINLPAESQKTVSLPATVDYPAALKILHSVGPGTIIPYEAKVQLTVDTPRLGPIMLPLTSAGELALPRVSDAPPASQ